MKHLLLSITLLCLSLVAQSQLPTIKVDRDEISRRISDASSPEFYPTLMKRFEELDTTLTNDEYRLIYYGFVFSPEYSPYQDLMTSEINEKLNEGKYKEAEKLCDDVLRTAPVSLTANQSKFIAMWYNDSTDARISGYVQRFYGLVGAIYSSGDGTSCETAFKTIFVSDEYRFMYDFLEIPQHHMQALVGSCDMFDIEPSEIFPDKKIWFDTSETLMYLSKALNLGEGEGGGKKKKKRERKKRD